MKRCATCVLPLSYPGLKFNEDGECNQCLHHKKREHWGEDKLREIIDSYRDKNNRYDCIVAFSGGRDSSFLLWYAVNVLNLKVLAVNIDNGFAPEQTIRNIKNATDACNVDLDIRKHDFVKKCAGHTLRSWLRNPNPGMIGLMCAGCMFGLRYYLSEAAKEHQIPLMLFGLGEPEPETTFAERYLMNNPHREFSKSSLVLGFFSQIARNPSYIMNIPCATIYAKEFVFRWSAMVRNILMRNVEYPELRFLEPFYYIEWDENQISSVIHDKLHWKTVDYSGSTWRTDCKIATMKNYLYRESVGFTKIDELLSNMVRSDMISREEALERIVKESTIDDRFIDKFVDDLGIRSSDFHKGIERARRKKNKLVSNQETG